MKIRLGFICFLFCLSLCCPVAAQVTVVEAEAGVSFSDFGYNASTGETTFISSTGPFGDEVYQVATLNASQDGFDFVAPANLPGVTSNIVLTGISTDGSRLSGYVNGLNSIDQGLTWETADLSDVVAIGRPDDAILTTRALAAWSGGVVGSVTNWRVRWDAEAGFIGVRGGGSFVDVSDSGQIAVGNFTDGAGLWDGVEVTLLAEEYDRSEALAVSPDGNAIGGFLHNLDTVGRAVIWEGDDFSPTFLLTEDNEQQFGAVTGLTDNGFAIGLGDFLSGSSLGFIYDERIGRTMTVNDWLLLQDPSLSFETEIFPRAIHWDSGSNTLRLTTAGSSGTKFFTIDLNAVPEPGSFSLLIIAAIGLASRRRRHV